tara:strand:+ start:308 stop:508 length:201 start_codon:yes stop_codon:yes gene_type:complete
MPLIKTIAARKSKSGNALFERNRKKPKSNVVKAKSGRVKKSTKLTATFSPSSYGKVGLISSKPKLL